MKTATLIIEIGIDEQGVPIDREVRMEGLASTLGLASAHALAINSILGSFNLAVAENSALPHGTKIAATKMFERVLAMGASESGDGSRVEMRPLHGFQPRNGV